MYHENLLAGVMHVLRQHCVLLSRKSLRIARYNPIVFNTDSNIPFYEGLAMEYDEADAAWNPETPTLP